MSELRRQLQRARDFHRGRQYPGDLAAEILPRRRILPWVGMSIGVGATALAAMLLLAIWLRQPVTNEPPGNLNGSYALNNGAASGDDDAVEVEDAEIQLIPPYLSLQVPMVPSFPSWESLTEDDQTMSREPV